MGMSIEEIRKSMEREGYIAAEEVMVTVFLALQLQKPLLVEGAPGVGKTEIAKVLSNIWKAPLIRLQCYEGLDEAKALYEWNYQKQLLKIQIMKDRDAPEELEKDLFGDEYLLSRPLLRAIRSEEQSLLLVDEVDKVEPEFEAFLFELLSDFQVTIPELGTVSARHIPVVVLTSNGERELSDALKRRCIYLYLDYPTVEKELQILRVKAPEAGEKLRRQVVKMVHYLRQNLHLRKNPSISETIDWARALAALGHESLDEDNLSKTLNLLLKNHDDQATLRDDNGFKKIMSEAGGTS